MARKKKATRKAARKPAGRKTTKKTAKRRGKKSISDMIISKARTKAASDINVSGDFYVALDSAVRELINAAEKRATDNGRKTLRPYDL